MLFNGKPVANKSVSICAPNGKVLKHKTDSAGEFRITSPKAGRYSFTTYHRQKDQTGKEEGKAYKGLMHGSSCTLNWPLKPGR